MPELHHLGMFERANSLTDKSSNNNDKHTVVTCTKGASESVV
jgi:hypothetical protein